MEEEEEEEVVVVVEIKGGSLTTPIKVKRGKGDGNEIWKIRFFTFSSCETFDLVISFSLRVTFLFLDTQTFS